MDNERNPSFVWQQLHQDPKPSGDRYKRMLDGELPWTTEDPGARFDRAIERLDAEVAQHEGDETAGLEIHHNLTDETISYRVLVQDESPLDDLEQTLAVAEEVGIGPSGEAPPAEPRHGARLRRWLASTESFMIDQFVDEAGRIADEIDADADKARLLVEMSEEVARGRADVAQATREDLRRKVEEAVGRLRYTLSSLSLVDGGLHGEKGGDTEGEGVDVLDAEPFLAELGRIFGDRPAGPPPLTEDIEEHELAPERRERKAARFEDREGRVEGVDR